MSELVLRPATAQLAMLAAGTVSVLELLEAHIAAIERLNPVLNVFADFDPDRARAEAVRLMRAGPGPGQPLFGLPVTVKSSIAVCGMRCETGSLLNRGLCPREDAEAVSRLRAAGALILGTTNCPEFLMAYETDNLLYGLTRNPWDPERTPGGSSGGESAAIAAGMSAAGLGSDSGGSVRVPAHFTGICSLKPTPGRIPGRGHLPPCVGPFSILGAVGPMARTIPDVALLLRALGGRDPRDPAGAPVPWRDPSPGELGSLVIGVFEDDGAVPVTGETREAVRAAAAVLEREGLRVERFAPRGLEELRRLWWRFFVQCGEVLLEPAVAGREESLSPVFRGFLEVARSLPPLTTRELLSAWAELDLARERMLGEMSAHPVLLCPVASVPAWRHGERSWSIDGREVACLDAVRHTQWFNTLGAPAAVVPVGRSGEGLPIGVQIVARPFADEIALAVAAVVDRAFGYAPPPI